MHHIDAKKTQRKNAWWKLHKHATSYLELMLEATPHETTDVRPLISHRKNLPDKTNKTCGTLMGKQGQRSSIDPYKWTVLTDQQGLTHSSSEQTENVVWNTYRKRWIIGMDGETETEGSKEFYQWDLMMTMMMMMLYIYIYIYIYIKFCNNTMVGYILLCWFAFEHSMELSVFFKQFLYSFLFNIYIYIYIYRDHPMNKLPSQLGL